MLHQKSQAVTWLFLALDIGLEMAQKYKLTINNEGNRDWKFYVYQKAPNRRQPDEFSLAWLVSPYLLRKHAQVEFEWSLEYAFIWNKSGKLKPGVTVVTSGKQECSPSGYNATIFKAEPAPGLSKPTKEAKSGMLLIKDDGDVAPDTFAVGIGMSGTGTFLQQAGPSLIHQFIPTPSYWVAAGIDVKVGSVLDIQSITPTSEVRFPPNVYSMTATLTQDNTWSIVKD